MTNERESVFVPCGHRCVCYQCGLEIIKKFNKCPICNQKALFLLYKVYDWVIIYWLVICLDRIWFNIINL